MHETPDDLAALQALLDRSFERAGEHFRRITTDERRLDAAQVCERLQGMTLLVLATVTKDGRPLNGPVDGIFYRGTFYFGSAPDSVRFRHIAQRPWVSATHLPAEEFAVTVHGQRGADRRRAIRPKPGSGRRCSASTSRATASSGSSSSTRACSTRASTPSACSRSPCRPSEA